MFKCNKVGTATKWWIKHKDECIGTVTAHCELVVAGGGTLFNTYMFLRIL